MREGALSVDRVLRYAASPAEFRKVSVRSIRVPGAPAQLCTSTR